jgi:hypothetical protein
VPVVEDYWSGVLRRLQSEVDVFNELILHAGERGRENELSFARILAGLIPSRYGVGTGLLIDSEDRYSRQTDIVIYNQADEPAILAQTSQVLFPVECTRACLEVKTSIGTEEIKDAGKKRASVAALNSRNPRKPIYALVGYKARSHAGSLVRELRSMKEDHRPDLMCVINLGFIGGYANIVIPSGQPGEYICGTTLLQERNDKGQRIEHTRVMPKPRTTSFTSKDTSYPVIKVGSDLLVAEPSRALLVFCEALVRTLAEQEGRSTPAFSHYITSVARDLLLLD